MSGNGRKRGPLVAEKRYPAGKKPAKKKAAPKKAAKPAARRKTTTRRKTKPRGFLWYFFLPFRWLFRLIWAFAWRIGMITGVIVAGFALFFASTLPPVEDLMDGRARGSVTMTDFQGQVFAWRGDQFGGMITTDTVSPHLHDAVVATEDKRFYRHFGISPPVSYTHLTLPTIA